MYTPNNANRAGTAMNDNTCSAPCAAVLDLIDLVARQREVRDHPFQKKKSTRSAETKVVAPRCHRRRAGHEAAHPGERLALQAVGVGHEGAVQGRWRPRFGRRAWLRRRAWRAVKCQATSKKVIGSSADGDVYTLWERLTNYYLLHWSCFADNLREIDECVYIVTRLMLDTLSVPVATFSW